MMKNITGINEFLEPDFHQHEQSINEMARVSGTDVPFEIWVHNIQQVKIYRYDHGLGHFHYNKKGVFELVVEVPSENADDLRLFKSSFKGNKITSWDGLSKDKNILVEWLKEINADTGISNLKTIVGLWNIYANTNPKMKKIVL